MRTARLAAGLALLLLAAGCADPGGPGTTLDPDLDVANEFDRRAAQIAAAWPHSEAAAAWEAGFLPVEPLTILPDRFATDETAQALAAGWLRTEVELTADRPDPDEVSFDDGTTLQVPLISLAAAWNAIATGEPECPDEPAAPAPSPTDPDDPASSPMQCTVLTVTDAYAGTVPVMTSRGPADVPAWLFEVAGVSEPLARVAVDPSAIDDVPRLSGIDFAYQRGLAVAMGLLAIDDADLSYQLGIGACDQPPLPLVYQTDEVVVVGGTTTLKPGTTACTDQLLLAELTVPLAAPLGQRPVLATTGEVLTFQRW